jgi:signal peptidase I
MTWPLSVHRLSKIKWIGIWLFAGIVVLGFVLHSSVRSYTVHTVVSGSMGRAVPRGSLIVSKKLSSAEYALGDVIVFPLPSHPTNSVTHRIVRIGVEPGKRVLATQGDTNPNGDGWTIPPGMVIGKVVGIIPLVGYLPIALQTKAGYCVGVVLAFVLVVLPFLLDAIKKEGPG